MRIILKNMRRRVSRRCKNFLCDEMFNTTRRNIKFNTEVKGEQ